MGKVKQIFTFFLAAVVLLTTVGFALHTIQCQLNGNTYYSVIDKRCCCESFDETGCCDEESLVVKADSQATLNEFNFSVNQILVVAFFIQYIELNFPAEHQVNYLEYFEDYTPFSEQEIIILVQSFLL